MSNLLSMTFKDEFEAFDKELSTRQEHYVKEKRMGKWLRVIKKWKKQRKVVL